MKQIKHGTQKGYNLHRYRGETPCAECKQGHSTYIAAQNRAKSKLAAEHAERYRQLFESELDR